MAKDIFKERGSADENNYFRKQDELLLQKLQEKARLAEVASALAQKLNVDNPDLLKRIIDHGVTLQSGAAFLLLPSVEVAWADGDISESEREAVLKIAATREVTPGSADYQQLSDWLTNRPSDDLFDTALEAIKFGLSVLPPDQQQQRKEAILQHCREVAEGSGFLHKLRHLYMKSGTERTVLDHIAARLNS